MNDYLVQDDPIVAEIRAIRREHAERFDYDLERIFQDLVKQAGEDHHEYVSLPPKPTTRQPRKAS